MLNLIQSSVMWLHYWFSCKMICLLPSLWCRWLHCWFGYKMVCSLLSLLWCRWLHCWFSYKMVCSSLPLLWCMLISADLWLYSSCRKNRWWSRWFQCISVNYEPRTVQYSDSWSQQWWYDKSILMLKNWNIRMKFM